MSTQKVVIVTGAGSGIGEAVAWRFAKDGYNVVLNGRTRKKLEKVANEIGEDKTFIVDGDVSSEEDVTSLIDLTIEKYGRLDVLVNNAAIATFASIDDLSLDDWNKQININVNGPFLATKYALPQLEKTKGAIVNVSSVSGLGGDWGGFAYNTTKGALNLMTKGLALDFATRGVRINAVAPSLTITDMSKFVRENDAVMEKFKDRLPMQRPATPEEVADVIFFLSSDQAAYVNGTIMPVDGGLNASNGQPNMG